MTIAPWDANLSNLRDILADLYYSQELARMKARQAGLNTSMLTIGDMPIANWDNILNQARLRRKVADVIEAALADFPDNQLLLQAKASALTAVHGTDINAVPWQNPLAPSTSEVQIWRQHSFLDVIWLETGVESAKSVVRVKRDDGSSGTGFVTDTGILVTNHHVLADPAQAKLATIQFNYQKALGDLAAPWVEMRLVPDKGFASSTEDDWTGVCIDGDWQAASRGAGLRLASLPERTPAADDFVTIVQHPAGGYKQIALYNNIVKYADNQRVQYLTDTLPGSSGAPVFNTNWQVVAVHHTGGWLREPGTKLGVYRNEGIHINVVLNGLRVHGLYS